MRNAFYFRRQHRFNIQSLIDEDQISCRETDPFTETAFHPSVNLPSHIYFHAYVIRHYFRYFRTHETCTDIAL